MFFSALFYWNLITVFCSASFSSQKEKKNEISKSQNETQKFCVYRSAIICLIFKAEEKKTNNYVCICVCNVCMYVCIGGMCGRFYFFNIENIKSSFPIV